MIAIYVRVSTEEQAKKGYSIKDQLRQCRDKAINLLGRSVQIKEYIDDGHSGEFLERPALTDLRNDIRDELIDTVIVYDPDRLSRKLAHQLLVTEDIEKRSKIVFVNSEYKNTPEGILFYQMRGAFSEFEKAKINERMSRGRREKAKQGKVVKDSKTYGYKYNKETSMLEVYEPEAKVIQLIFELFTNPQGRVQGINGIANYLNTRKIPTKKGRGAWHRQVVRQYLMNETYAGTYYHNKWNTEGILKNKYTKDPNEKVKMSLRPKEEWIPVEVPAIIDRKTFDLAQKLLKESRRRWAGRSKNKYFLSGMVRCGDCGNTMTGRRAKNWGKYVFEYTDIKNAAGVKNKGCGNKVHCEDLDGYVWGAFVDLMSNASYSPNNIAENKENDAPSFEENELERIESELEKIKTGRKRVLNFMATNSDIVDEEDIRIQLKDLKEEEESLLKLKDNTIDLIKEMKQDNFNEELLNKAVDQYWSNNPKTLTFEQKQEFIRTLYREIRVYSSGKIEFISM